MAYIVPRTTWVHILHICGSFHDFNSCLAHGCVVATTLSNGNLTPGMHMHIWPYFMLITFFLVILTYIFEMAAIWKFGLLLINS